MGKEVVKDVKSLIPLHFRQPSHARLPLMRSGTRRVSAVTILVGVVMLLVPALAWLQYRWVGQLSLAERERMQRTLRTAASQFAVDFDNEIFRTLAGLQVEARLLREEDWAGYAQRYSTWTESGAAPGLVRDVLLVDGPDLRLRRWNAKAVTFEPASWPEDLADLRKALASHAAAFEAMMGRGPDRDRRRDNMVLSLGDDATLVSPVTLFETNPDGPPKITGLGFTVIRLDPAVVNDTLIATLAARHLHGDDGRADYRIAVLSRSEPSRVIWESEAGAAAAIGDRPDVSQGFMAPRPDRFFMFARGRGPGGNGGRGGPSPADTAREPLGDSPRDTPGGGGAGENAPRIVVSVLERRENGMRASAESRPFNPFEGRWTLVAKHRAGSLEAAVAAVRTRNLLLSSGILLLLTTAVGFIVVSARRAQALARQQMEFVAAVSHELRTPVAVIGTAAGNLADGVVDDPQRVRKYGATIQGEARRLAETVERVLQLAGIAAGRAAAAPVRVNPADLVREAIEACRPEIGAANARVEVSVADNLPSVEGDAAALRSAVRNLVSNAVKYGGEARWVRVGVVGRPEGSPATSVAVTVEDRGPGVAADERRRIFEPFYRGRDAVTRQIHGSGLGLNLVKRIAEAHGGTVGVSSEPGKGTTFTLTLPAAPGRPEDAGIEAGVPAHS